MKKSQRDNISSMDDFEDLTLFANESFDTDEIDLFEFTSEESSPLTQLKSIILSLDWEISDAILHDLQDEINNLKEMWHGDKIAEVYLQGLEKIGNYIRIKGSFAHSNSIKLLLTFFYNFEKIISSTQITGKEITNLLKGDIRKFKILQYQIHQSEATSPELTNIRADLGALNVSSSDEIPTQDACKLLKAAILNLDWEATSENLRQFDDRIKIVQSKATGNKPALVLVQGMRALGDYITDERADSHPDSFILLHSFNDALEQVMKTGGQQLSQEQIQNLLVDRINRLNTLKMNLASPTSAEVDDQKLEQVFEELRNLSVEATPEPDIAPLLPIAEEKEPDNPAVAMVSDSLDESTGNLAAELDTLFPSEAMPAMESAGVQYPNEILPPDAIHPVEDELADDLIESHLSSKRGLTPALSDADETAGFNADAMPLDLPTQSDLARQLDFFFADSDDEEKIIPTKNEEPESDAVTAALSDADIPADEDAISAFSGETVETDEDSLELQSKLDSFFADADDGQEETVIAPALETAMNKMEEEENGPESDAVVAALSDADIPANEDALSAFSHEIVEVDEDSLELQNTLDSFFADADDDEQKEAAVPTPETATEIGDISSSEIDTLQPAFAASDGEQEFSEDNEIAASFTPMDEIEEKLDYFFSSEEENITEENIPPAGSIEKSPEAVLADPNTEQGRIQAPAALESDVETTVPADEVEELTLELESSLDDQQQALANESAEVQFAALGALLPLVVRTPSRDNLADAAAMIATLKQAGLSSVQQVLVQMLEATLALLVRLSAENYKSTEKLVNYLYKQLTADYNQANDILPEVIARFTTWLLEADRTTPVAVPTDAAEQRFEPETDYTVQELRRELTELRTYVREEIAKLQHEIQRRM
jgi:hypothetical protein